MKRVVVLGAGESGVGAAILASQNQMEVFVSDKSGIQEKYKQLLSEHQIPFEEKQHTESRVLHANLVIKSPGIPDNTPMVQTLKSKGIPVISEIEFAARYDSSTIVGITGSNGKTTTTLMTYFLFNQQGFNVGIGGNIGDSYAKQIAHDAYEYFVLELSSFQLDGIVKFAPHIAVITNITPDHLDRYDYNFEKYIAAKFRIVMNQTSEDYLIYDADDEVVVKGIKTYKPKAKLLPFSLESKIENGAYIDSGQMVVSINNEEKVRMDIKKLAMQGKHNAKNAMAASLAACLLKATDKTIQESLQNFEGAEHRLEKVQKINGVQYINDSKATNVNATYYALECMDHPTIWIVGGVDKGNDYSELFPLVREKVKSIICLGLENEKIKSTFENIVTFIGETQSADEAVKMAYSLAEKGDHVLLSPACASFDLFQNYEDRGAQFKNAVRAL